MKTKITGWVLPAALEAAQRGAAWSVYISSAPNMGYTQRVTLETVEPRFKVAKSYSCWGVVDSHKDNDEIVTVWKSYPGDARVLAEAEANRLNALHEAGEL